jgi:ubiquinone/menaquinone biosynthesis C-methylase UbiE
MGERRFFEDYDKVREKLHPYLVDILPSSHYSRCRVLEVGCGMGSDAAKLASQGAEVTAFDLSSASVKLTQKRFKLFDLDGGFIVGDAENLPFKDSSYDFVMSIGVLHHTPDTARAVDELHRVLREKGQGLVMLYYRDSFRYRILFKILTAVRKRQIDQLVAEYDGKDNPLGKVFSKREARKMFVRFNAVSMRVYNFYEYDLARLFESFSPHLTRIVARIVRRIPKPCFGAISRVFGQDLYIFAVKG